MLLLKDLMFKKQIYKYMASILKSVYIDQLAGIV